MTARHIHHHRPARPARKSWQPISLDVVPIQVKNALRDAMRREDIPEGDYDDLLWVMAQESSGMVNNRNGDSTARGFFQLSLAQYDLNPHGEASFGNAVEECQGGIRYIYGRYHSARAARAFWERHH